MARLSAPSTEALAPGRLDELFALLRIPSISTDPKHADDVVAAVAWVLDYLEAAGATVERREWEGRPLGVARLAAAAPSRATVMLYGHVDVQPPGTDDEWSAPPFEPTLRGQWIYGRGSADNKGPFFAMLTAAARLARRGELPVDVLVVCDAEEEVGGRTAVDYLRRTRPEADVCLILDTSLPAAGEPSLTLATRGIASYRVRVRTNEHDLHSGSYGGVALNAANALVGALAAVLPVDGQLPAALAVGAVPPPAAEREGWPAADGLAALAAVGAVPADIDAASDLQVRAWAQPAVDIHGLRAGETVVERNVVVAEADAMLSIRVAPGQDVRVIGQRLCEMIAAAMPEHAQLTIDPRSQTPPAGPFAAEAPAIAAAVEVIGEVFGRPPTLVRSGGSLPILAALDELGIECVVSGLDVPEGNVHAPDERLLVEHLALGIELAHRLLVRWGMED